MSKVWAGFFFGQFGAIASMGVVYMASQARKLDIATDTFNYGEVARAAARLDQMRAAGYKIALVGYSLGNTTTTYLQLDRDVDLLLAVAMSTLGANHPIRRAKRSVLWRGSGVLSSAGGNLGFAVTHDVLGVPHLLMDWTPTVLKGVQAEVALL